MSDKRLEETRISSELLFEGCFLHARRDQVRLPDGGQTVREYIVHPGAVVIVPLLDDGRLVLERQYRYPLERIMVELPAGKLDAGEDPLLCGQRELREETGYSAREWARAGVMHVAIAYSTEVIHIYFARGLISGQRRLDEGEFLDVFAATPEEFFRWCRDGVITDAKTLSCALWLQNVLGGTWALDWHAADHPPSIAENHGPNP
ncbi:MAG: NUDIX hydrolase [Burkholderiaceae bacterium]|jgi:ADP-ribose pyrophosphatase|nr:NUDIX hydrolase [Burkholderiaceae bacterium]